MPATPRFPFQANRMRSAGFGSSTEYFALLDQYASATTLKLPGATKLVIGKEL